MPAYLYAVYYQFLWFLYVHYNITVWNNYFVCIFIVVLFQSDDTNHSIIIIIIVVTLIITYTFEYKKYA